MGLLDIDKQASLPRPVSGCPVRYLTEHAGGDQSAECSTARQSKLTGRVRATLEKLERNSLEDFQLQKKNARQDAKTAWLQAITVQTVQDISSDAVAGKHGWALTLSTTDDDGYHRVW